MKKIFFLSSLMMTVLWISGCAQPPKPPHVPVPKSFYDDSAVEYTAVSRRIPVSGFDEVVVTGPVAVTINGHQLETQLIARSTPKTLKHFSAYTQKGVLYITSSQALSVSLDLAQPIQQLILGGNSVTRMTGDLVLSRIVLSDNAVLYAYWINSSNLHVVAKNRAKLFLAGVVTHLDMIATGDADVDAKYLRAEIAYVRTADDADVGVRVRRALSSFSTGKSTIYYYRDSRVEMHYLKGHGSALRMTGIP